MEARELRIGNWVKYSDSDIWIPEVQNMPIQVDIDILVDDEAATRPIEGKYNPIELTPEILEKCGFVRDIHYKDWYNYYHDNYCINFKVEGVPTSCYISVGFEDGEQEITTHHIQYLHQMQNLIHALTNTELPITL